MIQLALPAIANAILNTSASLGFGIAIDSLLDWISDDTINYVTVETDSASNQEIIELLRAFAKFYGIQIISTGTAPANTDD